MYSTPQHGSCLAGTETQKKSNTETQKKKDALPSVNANKLQVLLGSGAPLLPSPLLLLHDGFEPCGERERERERERREREEREREREQRERESAV